MSSGRINSTPGIYKNFGSRTFVNHFPYGPYKTPSSGFINDLSIDFGGTNERVDVDFNAALNPTDNLSIFTWIKAAGQNAGVFISHYTTVTANRRIIFYTSTNSPNTQFEVALSQNGSNVSTWRSTDSAFDGTNWYHVGFTFNGGTVKGWINGVETTMTRIGGSAITALHATTVGPQFGAYNRGSESNYFVGKQDEITWWDVDLSGAQISELYNSGSPADPTSHSASGNLVGWWRCGDGDTFPTLTNNAAAHSDGTMVNMEEADLQGDVP